MNLNKKFEEIVELHPEKVGLICKARLFSYRNLKEKIDSSASAFLQLGIKKGDKVGILMRNSAEIVIAYLGATKIGAIAVPINFLLKPEEITYILNDSEAVVLVTNSHFGDRIVKLRDTLPYLKYFIYTDLLKRRGDYLKDEILSFEELLSIHEGKTDTEYLRTTEVTEDDLASIIYTSGTTGKPKGVMLTHKNFLANVISSQQTIELKENDRILCLLPMFHSFAWTVCVLLPLLTGLTTVVCESIHPFTRVLQTIYKYKVTIFVAVPPVFVALDRLPSFVRFLSPIRLCVSGAAALPVEVLTKFEKKFRIPLLEGYGLTEASPVVSMNPLGKSKPGSIGLPIPGVSVKIIDDDGKDLPLGQEGELCVKGDNVMKGYYHFPEDTAATILPGGWLRTGDVAKIDSDGYIYILDRKKDLIIVKGINVHSCEIENVILRHPAVTETAVIGIPDGTGDE
ncbi:MAG TPA: long-chain fatty acid--CoA ligase, partial [Elusimicrobia bacterium]|nr:long-chain fatty acid--CoA ligase [Elusimicrobiota bacterium]